jgi:hypothetical protein
MPNLMKTEDYERCLKWYSKKKPRELTSVLSNLEILVRSLAGGKPIKPFVYGFLASEPDGVVRIAEGGNAGMAATRLYVYHETTTDTLYLLTIGDKRSQAKDIHYCSRVVRELTAHADAGDEEDESKPPENNLDEDRDRPGDTIDED